MIKKTFIRGIKMDKDPQGRNSSPRTDRHAINVSCTELNNITQFIHFTGRVSDASKL